MRMLPDGNALLTLSRQTVLDELLPLLPESAHYAARMVANAIAIAQRQLIAGEQALHDELEHINAWEAAAALPPSASLACAWEALAKAINKGALDGDAATSAAGRELLWQLTVSRLHESSPKALKALNLATR